MFKKFSILALTVFWTSASFASYQQCLFGSAGGTYPSPGEFRWTHIVLSHWDVSKHGELQIIGSKICNGKFVWSKCADVDSSKQPTKFECNLENLGKVISIIYK